MNSKEEGGPGWVSCAGMEKGELLHYYCEVIGICCSCLGDHVGTIRVALHCVVQRDHVEVTGGVFSSGENDLSILGNMHGCKTKVDSATMGTELRN